MKHKQVLPLEKYDLLGLFLWYQSHANFDINCYMWCTPNGTLPPPAHVDESQALVVGTILQANNHLQILEGSLALNHLTVSSARIYKIEGMFQSNLNCDNHSICQNTLTLLQHQQSILSVICTGLTGNYMGDYGISVNSSSGITNPKAGTIYKFNLNPSHSISFTFWHKSNMTIDPVCFVWGTEDGNLPSIKGTQNASLQALEDLVTTFNI